MPLVCLRELPAFFDIARAGYGLFHRGLAQVADRAAACDPDVQLIAHLDGDVADVSEAHLNEPAGSLS